MAALVEPLGEGLEFVGNAVQETRKRGKGKPKPQQEAAARPDPVRVEAAGGVGLLADSSQEGAPVPDVDLAGGPSEEVTGVPSLGTGSANMRREQPPRSRDATDYPVEILQQQASLARTDGQVTPGADEDLSTHLMEDGTALRRQSRWHVNWRVTLGFLGSITLGLGLGAVLGVVTGAMKDPSGAATGQALVAVGLVVLICCIVTAVCIVRDMLNNLEWFGGQMLNFAVAHMGVDILTKISDLESNNTAVEGVDWVINLMNPAADAITFSKIFAIVSMNDAAVTLFKSRPLPTELLAGATGPLDLEVKPRPGNKIRRAFESFTRKGNEWSSTFTKQTFDMSVEGQFRAKDFALQCTCQLPMRLPDLPLPEKWPEGLDAPVVERSYVAGLEDMHSDSGSMVSLPGKARSILQYESLEVTGPLVTWFTWMLILACIMALPASLCLSFGGMKVAGGGSGGAAAPQDAPAKQDGADAGAADAGAADAGAAASPPPAAAAPEQPEQAAESSPPAAAGTSGRSGRNRSPPKAAPSPPPAGGGGADDDTEF